MSVVRTPVRLVGVAAAAAIATLSWLPSLATADPATDLIGTATGQAAPVTDTVSEVVLKPAGAQGTVDQVTTQLVQLKSTTESTAGAAAAGPTTALGYSLNPDTVLAGPTAYLPSVAPKRLPDEAASKVTWIVRNSYPQVDGLTDLTGQLGLPSLGAITPKQAVAATQAAIWHYSAGTNLVPTENDPIVGALYGALVGAANVGAPLSTPQLFSAPASPAGILDLSGQAGDLVGPFTANENISKMFLLTNGIVQLRPTDGQAVPITSLKRGHKFFLQLPQGASPVEGVITAVGDPTAAVGRVVENVNGAANGQAFVLTDNAKLPIRQSLPVKWGVASQTSDGLEATTTCITDGVGVDLMNHSAKPIAVDVNDRQVTVPAGANKVVPMQVAEGAKYAIAITQGARNLFNLEGVRKCGSKVVPMVSAAPNCAKGGLDVTIANTLDRATEFQINGKEFTVAKNSTLDTNLPVAEGAKYVVNVVGENGFVQKLEGVRNCKANTSELAARAEADPKLNPAANADNGGEGGSSLPVTGAALGGIIAAGAALVGAGVLFAFMARRNRRTTTAE